MLLHLAALALDDVNRVRKCLGRPWLSDLPKGDHYSKSCPLTRALNLDGPAVGGYMVRYQAVVTNCPDLAIAYYEGATTDRWPANLYGYRYALPHTHAIRAFVEAFDDDPNHVALRAAYYLEA